MELQEVFNRDLSKHYRPNMPIFTCIVWTLDGETFDEQKEPEKTKDDNAIALFLEGTLTGIVELSKVLGFPIRIFPCIFSDQIAKEIRDSYRKS